jgi:hypothetical protein
MNNKRKMKKKKKEKKRNTASRLSTIFPRKRFDYCLSHVNPFHFASKGARKLDGHLHLYLLASEYLDCLS